VELQDILAHGTTGGASALTAGWLVKWLFKNWVRSHDETIKALTTSVQALTIEVTKISAVVARFDAVDKKAVELDKTMAVVSHRLTEAESDLNGLGSKVRAMETQ